MKSKAGDSVAHLEGKSLVAQACAQAMCIQDVTPFPAFPFPSVQERVYSLSPMGIFLPGPALSPLKTGFQERGEERGVEQFFAALFVHLIFHS